MDNIILTEMSDVNEQIKRFASLSNEELFALCKSLGLSLSPDAMRICRAYYASLGGGRHPSLELLKIFEVFERHTPPMCTARISDVFSEDREVMTSLYDLYSKAKCVKVYRGTQLTLGALLSVSEKYYDRIGIKAPGILSCKEDGVSIIDHSGKPLLSFSVKPREKLEYGYVSESEEAGTSSKPQTIPPNTVFVLIQSSEMSKEDYDNAIAHFTSLSELDGLAKPMRFTEKGIIDTLLPSCSGFFVDISRLPLDIEAGKELSALTRDISHETIFAVNVRHTKKLTELATTCGLKAIPFGKTTVNRNITFREGGHTFILKNPFLQKDLNTHSLKIKKEKLIPTSYSKGLTVSGEALTDGHRLSSGTYISARLTNDTENCFATGMNIVIDTLFSLLARGADRKKSGMTLRLGIALDSKEMAEEKLARVLSNLLGAYRASIELCLPDTASAIELNKSGEPSLFCSTYTESIDSPVADNFQGYGNSVYLISFKRRQGTQPDGMPDFENMRRMCDYLYSMISSGKISSARAFNGRLSDALEAMEHDDLMLVDKNIPENFMSQGFIVESAYELAATRIGKVGTPTQNNNTETIEVEE